MNGFSAWFTHLTGHEKGPLSWQEQVAASGRCGDRLIRVPTGMGKTEGILAAWLWNAVEQGRREWPRRLVWCLPMRVLVEQTISVAERLASRLVNRNSPPTNIHVHCLMGGVDTGDWHLRPEEPTILIGTQDMLLSRALNRGYAAGRARWPLEYGLLSHDCLWVMDEVQLMDVGLVTSVQLQAFRHQNQSTSLRPCHTWWMSATLQPDWLDTVDFHDALAPLRESSLSIPADDRRGGLWEIRKPLELATIPSKETDAIDRWVQTILESHRAAETGGRGRVTLVIVNRVEFAQELHQAICEALADHSEKTPSVELVHSRFRGLERRQWPDRFLSRQHSEDPQTNRIIIATQVVEAGVDISATALVTELAPWASLVQRFGRAARYGGTAHITVVDGQPSEKDALPYARPDLDAAREALTRLKDAGLANLESLEETLARDDPDLLARLYRYEYVHLLTRRECDELFDTSPDLTGADLDISRFIRSGEERDVHICWIPVDWENPDRQPPPPELQTKRDGLCPVPVHAARRWLFQKNRLKEGCRAWCWDYLDSQWRRLETSDCYPGQVILVDAGWGGYDIARGFTGERRRRNDPILECTGAFVSASSSEEVDELADSAQSREDLSQAQWKTIAFHGHETAQEARQLANELGLPDNLVAILDLAGRLHDWGKGHPAFQYNIRITDDHPGRDDLAKAPKRNWVAFQDRDRFCVPERNRQCSQPFGPRRGFRHELATTLALFELLSLGDRWHGALLGPYRSLVEQGVLPPPEQPSSELENPIANELRRLSADEFNLLLYLVCCHHGKVRGNWQATPQDQEFPSQHGGYLGEGQPLRGVREGDIIPAIELVGRDGQPTTVPALTLRLDPAAIGLSIRYGASWSERFQALLRQHGPFTLGYLEALLRIADIRASRLDTIDPWLQAKAAS